MIQRRHSIPAGAICPNRCKARNVASTFFLRCTEVLQESKLLNRSTIDAHVLSGAAVIPQRIFQRDKQNSSISHLRDRQVHRSTSSLRSALFGRPSPLLEHASKKRRLECVKTNSAFPKSNKSRNVLLGLCDSARGSASLPWTLWKSSAVLLSSRIFHLEMARSPKSTAHQRSMRLRIGSIGWSDSVSLEQIGQQRCSANAIHSFIFRMRLIGNKNGLIS